MLCVSGRKWQGRIHGDLRKVLHVKFSGAASNLAQAGLGLSHCYSRPLSPQLILDTIQVRKAAGINARSKVTVRKAAGDVYAATLDDKVCRCLYLWGVRVSGVRLCA